MPMEASIMQSYLLWLYSLTIQFYAVVHDCVCVKLDKNAVNRQNWA